jgi:ribulose 1,5-bisphosphate carboxylase large subunit-like protein
VRFSLGLPDELFPVQGGGLQLLVGLLAGDMFPTEVLGCRWDNVRVGRVGLADHMLNESYQTFRDQRAHTIEELRVRFHLPPGRPLLAFSFKPRVGPEFSEIRKITLDVLRAGFNLVELDSRNLALRSVPLEQWVDLGCEAAAVGPHVTAFSPNFSLPMPQLLEVTETWVQSLASNGPPVVKVDGGLDGLSGIQALRTHIQPELSPVVTCYPTLRSQLASSIGPSTWVEFLSISGVDIIYPGGRPTFPNERRPVWGSHAEDWSRAARIYDEMITTGWPMPTIAGGVHPGQLHACYELLGPNVAYFLGGAVALHPKSPRAGAALCVEVLEQAVELAGQAKEAGDDHSRDLSTRLLRKVEATRYPRTALNYYSPANIFGTSSARAFVPRTFYRRG